LPTQEHNSELIIYNLLGEEIQKQEINDQNMLMIDTGNFNNGIYLYVLKTNNEIKEKQKVIISK
jgi:hypothetical protein